MKQKQYTTLVPLTDQPGYRCGNCGSADDWIAFNVGAGCANCGCWLTSDDADRLADVEI